MPRKATKPKKISRAEKIYEMFREKLEPVGLLEGEAKIDAFLKAIDFEDSGELVKQTLQLVDQKRFRDMNYTILYLARKRSNPDFSESAGNYVDGLKNAFRNWKHAEEIRVLVNKNDAGIFDILRLYRDFIA